MIHQVIIVFVICQLLLAIPQKQTDQFSELKMADSDTEFAMYLVNGFDEPEEQLDSFLDPTNIVSLHFSLIHNHYSGWKR